MEKLQVFENSVVSMDSLSSFYESLTSFQKERLSRSGFDLEANKSALNEILFRETKTFVEQMKEKIKAELVSNVETIKGEIRSLTETIEKHRNDLRSLGTLQENEIEKSIGPLNSKLNDRTTELAKLEETLARLKEVGNAEVSVEPDVTA